MPIALQKIFSNLEQGIALSGQDDWEYYGSGSEMTVDGGKMHTEGGDAGAKCPIPAWFSLIGDWSLKLKGLKFTPPVGFVGGPGLDFGITNEALGGHFFEIRTYSDDDSGTYWQQYYWNGLNETEVRPINLAKYNAEYRKVGNTITVYENETVVMSFEIDHDMHFSAIPNLYPLAFYWVIEPDEEGRSSTWECDEIVLEQTDSAARSHSCRICNPLRKRR